MYRDQMVQLVQEFHRMVSHYLIYCRHTNIVQIDRTALSSYLLDKLSIKRICLVTKFLDYCLISLSTTLNQYAWRTKIKYALTQNVTPNFLSINKFFSLPKHVSGLNIIWMWNVNLSRSLNDEKQIAYNSLSTVGTRKQQRFPL